MNKAVNPNLVMMCIGAPIPAEVLEILKQIERPEMGKVQWTDPKNWFINFHNFFKMRPDLDLLPLKQALRKELFLKYFPMTLKIKEVMLLPSNQVPKTLECKFEIASIKDLRMEVSKVHDVMKVDMRETVKEACFSLQSIECEPSLILARIPESEKGNPDLIKLRDIKIPNLGKFYLDRILIVKVSKDEKGLNYEYIEVQE